MVNKFSFLVHTLEGIAAFENEFQAAGLTYLGEHGLKERLFFQRIAKDKITHLGHIHILKKGDSRICDHLDFRDYLNAEEEIAKEYEKLKIKLAEKYKDNPALYSSSKSHFIETILNSLRDSKGS